MTIKFFTSFFFFYLLAFSPLQAFLFPQGSVKGSGMGSTGVAYGQDSLAGIYNPAGMADIEDRVDIEGIGQHNEGLGRIYGNLIKKNNRHYRPFRKRGDFFFPSLGINKNLCCGMSLGLMYYNQAFIRTNPANRSPMGATTLKFGYEVDTLAPVWSLRIGCYHSFGVAANFNFQRLEVGGLKVFDNQFFSVAPGFVTNRGSDHSTGVGITFGWQTRISQYFTFGITYQPQTHMQRFKKYKGFLADRGRMDLPEVFSAGLAFYGLPCLTLTFDVRTVRVNAIKSWHNSFFPTFPLNKFGERQGPGFGWHNTLSFHFGIAYQHDENWTFRIGCIHTQGLLKRNANLLNLLTFETIENYVSLGMTWAVSDCQELSVFYEHGYKRGKTGPIPLILGFGMASIQYHFVDRLGLAWGMKY